VSVEVLTGVLALGAVTEGDDVLVDLYGSSSNICGSVRFPIGDAARREQTTQRIEQWAAAQTPLTFVRRGREITLQDDAKLYGEQLVAEA
jgi:hypothetical protein